MNVRTTETEAISPRPLHGEVAERLRRLIIHGEIPPGERLNERLLAERFSISRTPLRDALKLLSAEGLVEILPYRGAVVSRVTLDEAEGLFQVLSALEGLAGDLACQKATEADIAEIEALHADMRRHYERGELDEYFALNQRIHQAIVNCAQNAELTAIHSRLAQRIRCVRYVANFSPARWTRAMAEHEEILEALRQRDGVRLQNLLKTHLGRKFESVREWLLANQG